MSPSGMRLSVRGWTFFFLSILFFPCNLDLSPYAAGRTAGDVGYGVWSTSLWWFVMYLTLLYHGAPARVRSFMVPSARLLIHLYTIDWEIQNYGNFTGRACLAPILVKVSALERRFHLRFSICHYDAIFHWTYYFLSNLACIRISSETNIKEYVNVN